MPASRLPDGELAFTYFPGNYRWSHGVLIALGGAPWGGAEIDEVHRIGLRLKDRDGVGLRRSRRRPTVLRPARSIRRATSGSCPESR